MTVQERLRQLAAALPSDGASVTFTRADLLALLDGEAEAVVAAARDLTVEEVAEEMHRAPSTVRGWLIAGELAGYKLNRRDWRIPRAALARYIAGQEAGGGADDQDDRDIDIGAWRKLRGTGGAGS